MKPKHQRLLFIGFSVVALCIATLLILQAFRENLVFFYSPSDIAQRHPPAGQMMRVGGLVVKGSTQRGKDDILYFTITDGKAELKAEYKGMVPTLFREGQGAVAEGMLKEDGSFNASRILTKHDE